MIKQLKGDLGIILEITDKSSVKVPCSHGLKMRLGVYKYISNDLFLEKEKSHIIIKTDYIRINTINFNIKFKLFNKYIIYEYKL